MISSLGGADAAAVSGSSPPALYIRGSLDVSVAMLALLVKLVASVDRDYLLTPCCGCS